MAEIGSVLGGRYRLVELLGQGGMATIYRAADGQLGRDVALKVLRPQYGRDPDFLARFRQEAQAAASLNHPNIVAVYDYGRDEQGPFIVMELVDGEDLASLVRRNGPLPPRQVARIGSEIARALGAAHARGIVHRDVKSSNVLLARDGHAKVTDFGIARAMAEAQLTLPGTTLGSVHYFSPEQARGETATPASDVYSLGVVLYELLTGRRPWEGDSAAAVAMARLTGPVPSAREVRPSIPPALDAIIGRALAPEPSERYPTANAMAEDLDRFLADAPVAAAGGAAAGAAALGGAATGALAGAAIGSGSPAVGSGSPTIASGVARTNPPRPVYPPDAYAGMGDEGRRPPMAVRASEPDEPEPSSGPWGWVAAVVGLLILAVAAFIVFQLVAGRGAPSPTSGTVPNLVGQTLAQADANATAAGFKTIQAAFVQSNAQPAGTVSAQDPPANASATLGSTIKLTIVTGAALVAVPDVRGQQEATAVQALQGQGFTIGGRSEAFDPTIPAGSIVSTNPGGGIQAAKGTPVSYVVSKGPEPSPSPTPTPTPAPTPTPTPTVAPTPAPRNVGEYRCMTLNQAEQQIVADGFRVGQVSAANGGHPKRDWIVVAQSPAPGTLQPAGTPIDLSADDPAALPTCPPA